MAESTLSLTFQNLYRQAAWQGWGVNTHTAGTVTIASGVVTFTSALSTLTQAWAAAGFLQVGTNLYSVNTYDSTTQVTLDDTSVTAAAGTPAVLTQATQEIHDKILETIEGGLRTFRNAHSWSFLNPSTTISTVAAYSTGTVTISSGVVTFSTALPATEQGWAASGELIIGGTSYTINTYDSSTQVTLDDTSVTAAAGTSFTMAQSDYDLPDNFASLRRGFTFRPGDDTLGLRPIEIISEHDLRSGRQRRAYTDRPRVAAIRVKTHDATVGTRWEVLFGPALPDAVYQLRYTYAVRPDELTPANKYFNGGSDHSETIRCAVRAAVEAEVDDVTGVWTQRYMMELANSIQRDGETAPDFLGYNSDRESRTDDSRRPWRGTSQYTGQTLT